MNKNAPVNPPPVGDSFRETTLIIDLHGSIKAIPCIYKAEYVYSADIQSLGENPFVRDPTLCLYAVLLLSVR